MKNFRILLVLAFAMLVSGCFDRGSRNPDSECGMKANGQQVVGYNGQICADNSEYQGVYMVFPETIVNILNVTDEAKEGIQKLFKENKALAYFGERFSGIVKILQTHVSDVAIWMIVIYLCYSVMQTLFELSRMTIQHLDKSQERFSLGILGWNYVKFACVLLFIVPIGYDANNVYGRYAIGTPFKIGQENLAFTQSVIISDIQQGRVESTPLTESARAYSSVNWVSWSLNNMMIKGKVRDNRTAKLEYHDAIMVGGKYVLPVEHSASQEYIFRSNNKIELKRYSIKDEAQKQVKVRNLLSYSGKVTFNEDNISSRDANNLIASSPTTYLSTQPSEITGKAKAMIAGMVSVHGEDIMKNPEAVNRAVIAGVVASMPPLVETYMIREQTAVAEITRLVEELFCTQTPLNPETKYNNNRFITNVAAGKFFEPNMVNKCIGQNGDKYIPYGQRDYTVVESELNQKYKELVTRGYEYHVSIVGQTKDITINDDTAEYCKKARTGGLRGAILYTDKCVYANTMQADYTDYITNSFIAESVGYDHYIDTETRVNDDWYKYSPAMNDDFDPIVERLFRTIPVKVSQGQVSQEAYLRGMADSYDESAAGMDSIVNMFTSPVEAFKGYLGIDKAKPDPMKVKQGIQKMFVKGVSLGTTMFMGGTIASGVDNALEMNKDKSKKTSPGYSGKGTGKMGMLAKGFVKLVSAMQTPGLIIGIASVVGLLFFALPKIVFIFIAFSYTVHAIYLFINSALIIVKLARLDDKGNFAHHFNKLYNNVMYLMLTPVIIISLYYMVMVFEGEVIAYTAMQLMKIQTHNLMESIAFVCTFVVTIGVMTQAVLATALISYSTLLKEMFGEDQNPSPAQHALTTAMFIVKWSLPFVGLLVNLFTQRKR